MDENRPVPLFRRQVIDNAMSHTGIVDLSAPI